MLVLCAAASAAERIELVAGGKPGELEMPFDVKIDRAGNALVVEFTGNRLRQVDPQGNLTTLAGSGRKGAAGDGGPALDAQFDGMHALAIGPNGAVYLADTWNSRVRKLDPRSGKLSNFAGTGQKGFAGDGGPAEKAQLGNVYCVALDPAGKRMVLADLDNRRIRAIDMATRTVSTLAGNGEKGAPSDGADARRSPLVDPRAVAADAAGNVYILERSGHALRVVGPDGKIRTLAGTGKPGHSGDGDDARQATLNGPKHLAIDAEGNVLIVDTENHAIRKYLPREGKIVRVAGTGKPGSAGVGGPPQQCELNRPHGVCVSPSGDIYIADSDNHRLLRISGK
jgi:DNA-binding beta-propeller fold protein YncE